MVATILNPIDVELDHSRSGHAELIARIERILPQDGRAEPLAGVRVTRASEPTKLGYGTSYPSFLVVAQGSKEIRIGDNRYLYDAAHYLITTAALPISSRIVEASSERPYMSMHLMFDPLVVGSVMVEAGRPILRKSENAQAIAVSELDPGLLDAMVRLARLFEESVDARFLAPLLMREIVYRLLTGEQGSRLRHLATLNGYSDQVSTAIERIRTSFDQPLRIDSLAGELGMSLSSFHQHFKEVTAMSPLQFQKQLRLHEARRLMLGEFLDASSAGYRVGYDDASQFNREYKRLFGEPPMRDVERMRETSAVNAGL